MAFVKREAGNIYYTVQGHGEPLLMLGSVGRSSRYWLGFDKVMAQHCKVVTLDLRGLGKSRQDMGWDDSLDTLADDCIAVMDAAGADTFHVFGLSFGGMIAQRLGIQHGERIKSLTIASSSSADYLGLRAYPQTIAKLLFGLRSGRFQDALLEALAAPQVLRSWAPEIQNSWQEILDDEGFPLVTIVKQLKALVPHKIKGELSTVDFPILLLHGSLDKFVPLYNSLQLQKLIPGSEMKVIKGAGHEIALGNELELSKVLREFMESPN